MKKIALFGGTGYVGSRLREKLLDKGYQVRMLVRNTTKLRLLESASMVETVYGRIEDPSAVLNTLIGTDACIVVTGPRTKTLVDMHTIVSGTSHILAAMNDLKIKRLIKLSGTSVRIPGEIFPLTRRFLDIALGIALKNPSKSKYLEHEMIMPSDLDWTLVRPPVIADKEFNKPFSAHEFKHLGLQVGLNDLCAFMIDQLEDSQWIRKAPVVGYK